MKYHHIKTGKFLARPNRFLATVEIGGKTEVCHVKNTGRCRELLTEGAEVVLEYSDNPNRKTACDLVAVYKGDRLINMDSQAPNRVFGEWAEESGYFGNITKLRPETVFGDSRFDFYIETDSRKLFVEVKGVTLEENGAVLFPDAPTERGVKHIHGLEKAVKAGYEAFLFFVIQMDSCRYFTPNRKTHPAFAEALEKAQKAGVQICAVTCHTEEDSLSINGFADVVLHPDF